MAAAALSGNDLSVRCQRISFKGALKLIAGSSPTSTSSMAEVIAVIQTHGELTEDDILEMYLSFNNQPVYDPATKKIVRLNPVPKNQERLLATSAGLLKDHQVGFGNLQGLGRPVDPFAFEPWVLALDKPSLLDLLVEKGGLLEADLQGADVMVLRNVYARVAGRDKMAVESTSAEAQKTTEHWKRILATGVLFECSDPGKAAVAVAVITPTIAQRSFLQGTNWGNGLMSVGAIQSYAKGIAVVDRIVSFKWGKVDGCVSDEFIRANVSSSVKALEYNVVLSACRRRTAACSRPRCRAYGCGCGSRR